MNAVANTQIAPVAELSEHIKALARRFLDCCYDGAGHTLSKAQMKELEGAGLVTDLGNGYHAETPLMRQADVY